MRESLEQETQRKIYTLLSKNPGLSLSTIAETLNIKISMAERYLSFMEKNGEINTLAERGFLKYYIRKRKLESESSKIPETRQKIYDLILINPGLHLSEIAKRLEMSISLAEYHLVQMTRSNQIQSVKGVGGYYKRFYIQDSEVGINEATILALLRQKTLLKIVLLLWKKPNLRHRELLKTLDVSKSTLTYHIDKLVEHGVVEKTTYGEDKGYALKNENEIIWIIRRYKLAKTLDRFKDLWSDL